MNVESLMSTVTSADEIRATATAPRWRNTAIALEVLFVYAGILQYIWRWQFTHPLVWAALWAVILLSHALHRDTLRTLGLAGAELRASAQLVLPLAVILFVPVLIYGFASHRLVLVVPNERVVLSFFGYGLWCVFQQYLAQSYIHNRLRSVVANPHLSSLAVALMFGAAHIPNPVLMAATTAGGFLLAEVFARHRNIWPLALAQAVGGFLLASVVPDATLHHMRVGPGYFFFGLR